MNRLNTFWYRLVLLSLSAVLASGALSVAPAQADDPDYWPTDGWRTSTPEEQGIDTAGLMRVLTTIQRSDYNINSVTVVRHGYVVLDAYLHPFAPDETHIIHSCTKSFTSALIGIAIEQGYLTGPDQLLTDIFPEREMAQMDADKAAITLGDLLMMAAGWDCRDSYLYNWEGMRELRRSEDWVQHALDLPMSEPPGTEFEYCNSASFLLAAIIQEATGVTPYEFAQEHLFGPLGFGEAVWPANPAGINIGWGELRITPHDMAKFGYLYLKQGEWDGAQIVPVEWVEESTQAQIEAGTLGPDYGYQWWIESDRFYAAEGYAGQYIFVVPELDMVVAFTSGLNGRYFETPQRLLETYIIPAVTADEPLSANPGAFDELTALVAALANPEPEPVPALPDIAQQISGVTYAFDANDLGFETVTLMFADGAPEAEIMLETGRGGYPMPLHVGLDGLFRFVQDDDGENWALRGQWDGDVFSFTIKTMRHPWEDEYEFRFGDGKLSVTVRDNVNGGSWRITGSAQ